MASFHVVLRGGNRFIMTVWSLTRRIQRRERLRIERLKRRNGALIRAKSFVDDGSPDSDPFTLTQHDQRLAMRI
jgi:hypothetical protein